MSSETASPKPPPLPLPDRLRQGWDLAVVSLRVVRRRKRIVLLPVIGFLALLTILGTFLGGTIGILGLSPTQLLLAVGLLVVIGFALNLVLYFLLVLVNAAVAVFALDLFDGLTPTVRGSLRRTYRGGKPLVAWALIAAAGSTLLRTAQSLVPQLNPELTVAGFLWTFFVPLVAPIVLFEGLGPFRAVRRSTTIRRSTWVEGISGLASVYAIFFLLGSVGVLPPLVGYLLVGLVGLGVGLIPAVVYLIPLFFVGTTTKSVLVAVVYRYGTTGDVPAEFRGTMLRGRTATPPAEEAP